jgi:hypothetical protein
MQANNPATRQKQLTVLKLRVELIAWRVQEKGMSPEIRKAIPESTVDVFGQLLYETDVPDEIKLMRYEAAVRQAEEDLARNGSFWRNGNETLH